MAPCRCPTLCAASREHIKIRPSSIDVIDSFCLAIIVIYKQIRCTEHLPDVCGAERITLSRSRSAAVRKVVWSFATHARKSVAMYASPIYSINCCEHDLQAGNEGIPAYGNARQDEDRQEDCRHRGPDR